jgi:outer membrane lipoprotein-sorting protein
MNMFRKVLLTLPAGMLALTAFAQPPAQKTDPNYDPKAKLILDDVSKTAKSYATITASFSISLKKTDGTTDVKNGSIIMKSGRYKIVLENSAKGGVVKKEEYYNDGKTTWVYSEKDGEVTIDCAPDPAAKKNENSISPNDIFTIHEKGFKYKFIKEETQNGKAVQLIDLYPEKPDKKNYHTVKLTIDKAKKQIINVVFLNKDQTTTTYTVKSLTPNLEVADGVFQFDSKTHPGVSVIDLREGDCKAPSGR